MPSSNSVLKAMLVTRLAAVKQGKGDLAAMGRPVAAQSQRATELGPLRGPLRHCVAVRRTSVVENYNTVRPRMEP